MSYNKIHYKTILVAILLFTSSVHFTQAQSISKSASSEQTSYSPSSILLSQTLETVSLVQNGITHNLPKIKKELIPQSWVDNIFSAPDIREENIIQQSELEEMKELSSKLGISVRSPRYLDLYREAAGWLGTRYRWAGNTKKGTDCSGLTGKILKNVYDKEIDRSSNVIAGKLKEEIDTHNLLPGDLVFFSTLRRKGISHVGVYLGQGHFIHASRKGVVVSSLDEEYYARTYRKAGRL